MLRFGPTSTELCGGTHARRTGDTGLFKLVSEGGVSAGVRRIEALTGQGALDFVAGEEQRLAEAAALLGGSVGDVGDKLRSLLDRHKKLERELEALKAKAASGATSDLGAQAVDVGGIKVLAVRLEGFDAKALRDAVDRLKQQLGMQCSAGRPAVRPRWWLGHWWAPQVRRGSSGPVASHINGRRGRRPGAGGRRLRPRAVRGPGASRLGTGSLTGLPATL